MKKNILILSAILFICTSFTGCAGSDRSKIEGVDDAVYQRGMAFIEYMDENQMIGETEGLEQLNAIAEDDGSEAEIFFEEDIYILWIYHNLKCEETSAAEINATWEKMGIDATVQEKYKETRKSILNAKTKEDLQKIYDSVVY